MFNKIIILVLIFIIFKDLYDNITYGITDDVTNDKNNNITNDKNNNITNDKPNSITNDKTNNMTNDKTNNMINDKTNNMINDKTNDKTNNIINHRSNDINNNILTYSIKGANIDLENNKTIKNYNNSNNKIPKQQITLSNNVPLPYINNNSQYNINNSFQEQFNNIDSFDNNNYNNIDSFDNNNYDIIDSFDSFDNNNYNNIDNFDNNNYDNIDSFDNNILQDNIIKENNSVISEDFISDIINVSDKKIHNNVDINEFGKPYDYKKNEYILWEFQNPNPWTKILYKYNDIYPYHFHIKVKIPSLNDYENWKNIISNLNFNAKSGEIILPTNDEITALAVINLMISNFKGNLSLDEIINKNLIETSIIKANKYEIIKNKIREQIIDNNNPKINISHNVNKHYEQDLANNNVETTNYYYYNNDMDTSDKLQAYEGSEFSFI